MKNDYLKRFELENLEKVTKECQKTAETAGVEAVVPIEAAALLRMLKEIKRRRFLSHRYYQTKREQAEAEAED